MAPPSGCLLAAAAIDPARRHVDHDARALPGPGRALHREPSPAQEQTLAQEPQAEPGAHARRRLLFSRPPCALPTRGVWILPARTVVLHHEARRAAVAGPEVHAHAR